MPAGRHGDREVDLALDDDGEAVPPCAALGRLELARLSAREQAVLRLRFLEGRSVADTAAELGLSPGNLKVIQHRALRRAAGIAQELAEAATEPTTVAGLTPEACR